MSIHIQNGNPPLIKDITITDDGTMVAFTMPSLAADALNRDGNILLWKIAKIFECGRVTAVLHPDFFMNKMAPSGDLSKFIILFNMNIGHKMYTRTKTKGWCMPLDLMTTLTRFGRTSSDYITFIEDPDDHETLASLRFRYATVSLTSRKSVEISSQIKTLYGKYQKPAYAVQLYTPSPRPSTAHMMTATVKPSDIDRNNHLNNCDYLRLCMDAATEAAYVGHMHHFRDNLTNHRAQQIQGLYRRECRLGDCVTVHCWEDELNPLMLHFEIMKEDNVLSFQCSVAYYLNEAAKL